MSEFQVHDSNFEPRKSGRTPLVDVSGLIAAAAKHEGQWVSGVYPNKEAASIQGQLKRRGYEVVTNIVDADRREVFVRYVPA